MQLQMITSDSRGSAGQPRWIHLIFSVQSDDWSADRRRRPGWLFAMLTLNEQRLDWLIAKADALWNDNRTYPQKRHEAFHDGDDQGFFMPRVFSYHGCGADKREIPSHYRDLLLNIEADEDETGICWHEVKFVKVPNSPKELVSRRLEVSLADPRCSDTVLYEWTARLKEGGDDISIGPMDDDEIRGLRTKLLYG